jgi:hypothetical protein
MHLVFTSNLLKNLNYFALLLELKVSVWLRRKQIFSIACFYSTMFFVRLGLASITVHLASFSNQSFIRSKKERKVVLIPFPLNTYFAFKEFPFVGKFF